MPKYLSYFLLFLTFLLCVPFIPVQAATPACPGTMTGTGISGDECLVTSWTDLNNIRNNLTADYKLTINLSSTTAGYAGIGDSWTPIGSFSGKFDGNSKTISDLIINSPTMYVGLFSSTMGDISNIGLINVNVTGSKQVGALVGYQQSGTISNSYSTGSVFSSWGVGGLVGLAYGTISNSFSTANVTMTNPDGYFSGGLVGYLSGTISNSYAIGNVSGASEVGGLVGRKDGDGQTGGIISNSYSTGSVTGIGSYIGGLVARGGGSGRDGAVSHSYWDAQTSGQLTSSGGTGKTTAEMKAQSTYVGWDFTNVWQTVSGNYPVLRMLNAVPPIAAPTSVIATAGDTQAEISFTEPTSDGGSPIISYTVTSSPGDIIATGTDPDITMTGLTNGTPYTFTVTATNVAGVSPASVASPSVTPYPDNEIYIRNLVADLGITDDTFNLSADSKTELESINTALNNNTTNVVFNGNTYADVETANIGTTYYLKPKGGSIPTSKYLELLKQEIINPDDYIYSGNNSEIAQAVYKIYYDALIANQNIATTEASVKTYLNQQVSSGAIASYEYDSSTDSLMIYYPGLTELGFQLSPQDYVDGLNYMVTSYADGSTYSANLLDSYEHDFSTGQVLIVNTQTDNTNQPQIIDRSQLQGYLPILLNDSLTKDQKLVAMFGEQATASAVSVSKIKNPFLAFISNLKNVFLSFVSNVKNTFLASISGTKVSTSAVTPADLLNHSGTIVPPTKEIYYIPGPSDMNMYAFTPAVSKKGLEPFIANGYSIVPEPTGSWGSSLVDTLAGILQNPNDAILYINGHGRGNYLLAETYDFGKVPLHMKKDDLIKWAANNPKVTTFFKRVDDLKSKYSGIVTNADSGFSISGELDRVYDAAYYRHEYFSDDAIGKIGLNSDFFSTNTLASKKALIFFESCYGGSVSSGINSRAILTSNSGLYTDSRLFTSDLEKFVPYLTKSSDATLPTPLTRDYSQHPFSITSIAAPVGGFTNSLSRNNYYNCISDPNRLCTITPIFNDSGTVAVSPNVKYINKNDSDQIEFNAPMDDSASLSSAVTMKFSDDSKCSGNISPEWVTDSDGFSTKVKLNGLGTVYRDWATDLSDFNPDGTPNVPYATITIHHALATSIFSNVELTGNTDACASSGCSVKDGVNLWADPANIKYNGNNPKSDFVFMMPCIPTCSGSPYLANPGDTVTWTAVGGSSGSTYSWSGDASGSGVSTTNTYNSEGTKTANVTITKGSNTYQATCSVTMLSPPPLEISVNPNPEEDYPCHEASFSATVDPQGCGSPICSVDPLPAGAIFDATTCTFTWIPTQAQIENYALTFTATDSCGQTASTIADLAVRPNLNLPTNPLAIVGEPIKFSITDQSCKMPVAMAKSSKRNIFQSMAASISSSINSFTANIFQSISNFITGAIPAVVNSGEPVFTYSANSIPTGATLDVKTGDFSWTPTIPQIGTTTITFTVTATMPTGRAFTNSKSIDINVSPQEFCGGDGSTDNPYQICNWTQLNKIRNNLSSNYILTTDLSSSTADYTGLGNNWTPVGAPSSPFTGSFNGGYHTISDLVINLPSNYFVGLFGQLSGSISNLGLLNANVLGLGVVGGFVGRGDGSISNSYITGNVSGLESDFTEVGGMVGADSGSLSISNSYSSASVSGPWMVGGLVGSINAGSITNSYATGHVSGNRYTGGLIGYFQNGTVVTNSYWDKQTTGQTSSAVGGTGESTVDMKNQSTYVGWDFTKVWQVVSGNYPILRIPMVLTTHTVTFDDQGASALASPTTETVTFPATNVSTLPTAPTKTGYTFGGWYTAVNGGGTQFIATTPVTANITVYANWTAELPILVWADSDQGSMSWDNAVASCAQRNTNNRIWRLPTIKEMELKIIDSSFFWMGYWSSEKNNDNNSAKVKGGYYNSGFQGQTYDFVLTATAISARCVSDSFITPTVTDTYTVTFDSQSATVPASPTTKTVISPATTVVTLPTAPTKTGYTFGGWYTAVNGGGTQFIATTPVTANITVYAKWTVGSPVVSATFTTPLKFGMKSNDVKRLQQFLNTHGFVITTTGAGSPGNETTLFGIKMWNAVKKFQEHYASELLTPFNLTKGTGFVGTATLNKINSLISNP